ncbi:MAG: ATP-grasp domain-containing protein [Fidelibacterota bacterium]
MARLFEFQGKNLLKNGRIPVPEGEAASNPQEAYDIAARLGRPVVIKAQTWFTGRASVGGILFADTPEEARIASQKILGTEIRNFKIEKVLVEERLNIEREFYAGIIIDDRERAPVILVSSLGGTGIEEIARIHPDKIARKTVNPVTGIRDYESRNLLRKIGFKGATLVKMAKIITDLFKTALKFEARAAEINPLVLTANGNLVAADCRIAIDDYAVFRHPELQIEIARDLDHPPTPLDKISYNVEMGDYRGTFYFIQMERDFKKGEGYIGFHGAGGGGSMMSMDALFRKGFKLANFCDTSGNPPASKVYRAARIILSQPGIDGYFGSGSGVASQEQFHSARGLVKAFREQNLSIPAVIRLGGNSEDKAVEILENYTEDLPAPVEGYKKDDPADFCAERMKVLISRGPYNPSGPVRRAFRPKEPYSFNTMTGEITFDHALCRDCSSKICIEECIPDILKTKNGLPVLAITEEEAKRGKCIECLACELECEFHGNKGAHIDLPIPGLEEYLQKESDRISKSC